MMETGNTIHVRHREYHTSTCWRQETPYVGDREYHACCRQETPYILETCWGIPYMQETGNITHAEDRKHYTCSKKGSPYMLETGSIIHAVNAFYQS